MFTLFRQWIEHFHGIPKGKIAQGLGPRVELLESRDMPSAGLPVPGHPLPPGGPPPGPAGVLVAGIGNGAPPIQSNNIGLFVPDSGAATVSMALRPSSSTMPSTAMMMMDDWFEYIGDNQRVLSALDDAFIADVGVPQAAAPAIAVELVPVCGSPLDAVSILLNESAQPGMPPAAPSFSDASPQARLPFADERPAERGNVPVEKPIDPSTSSVSAGAQPIAVDVEAGPSLAGDTSDTEAIPE
jgi:hypothetical protein